MKFQTSINNPKNRYNFLTNRFVVKWDELPQSIFDEESMNIQSNLFNPNNKISPKLCTG